VAAPALVVFLILTGVPIVVTPVVQALRGETATWGILAPIGTLTVGLCALLRWAWAEMRGEGAVEPHSCRKSAKGVPPAPIRRTTWGW
jgi:hypothetical protein